MYQVRKLEYIIDDVWDGKIVKALLQHEGFSATVISGLKKNPKGICIGNKKVTVLKTLHKGDILTIRVRNRPEDEAADRIRPTDIPVNILYEDEDIAVVNKPADLPTHTAQHNHDHTLGNAMAFHWAKRHEKYIYRPISRLDKDTTGVLIIAKNAHAAGKLGIALKNREIKRRYIALVSGKLDGEGRIDVPIVRDENSIIKRKVASSEQENEHNRAITHYQVLESNEEYSLVLLQLETGRTHQIRVHMSHLGHSLCGDWLYGKENELLSRPALHSYDISFVHPITCKKMHFIAPVSEDMRKYIRTLSDDGVFEETI